ncbi:TPA: hypothetical protein DIS61_00310 [Patescibacteria group bacterium]|nr:hypothetical protein [Patescibacteria group bacterium]
MTTEVHPKISKLYLMPTKMLGGGKTTFFVMGDWLERSVNREIANRIVDEGHVLGCHGFHHDPFTTLSREEMSEQFAKFTRVAGEVVPGYKVRFFRPPYGDRNQEVREEAAKWGMQTAMWSMSSGGHDYTTYTRVVRGVDKGTIVLSHSTRYYDVNQAAKIVTGLVEAGYSLESMDTGLDPNDYWKNATALSPIQRENLMPEVADAKGRI